MLRYGHIPVNNKKLSIRVYLNSAVAFSCNMCAYIIYASVIAFAMTPVSNATKTFTDFIAKYKSLSMPVLLSVDK